MKNLNILFPILIIILFISASINSQDKNSDTTWSQWQPLIGTWKGNNSGEPGQGEGYFTFGFELSGNILMRKGHTVFPGHENQPARVHDDVLIIYKENSGVPDKADYFDSEGHVLHYNISYSGNGIVILTSIPVKDSPVFRLTFIKMDNTSMDIKFEYAMPGNPDEFKVLLEGLVIKTE
ncbi:MAG: hypothetical protein ACHQJ4_00225 [Ignavibacteria bacterium]